MGVSPGATRVIVAQFVADKRHALGWQNARAVVLRTPFLLLELARLALLLLLLRLFLLLILPLLLILLLPLLLLLRLLLLLLLLPPQALAQPLPPTPLLLLPLPLLPPSESPDRKFARAPNNRHMALRYSKYLRLPTFRSACILTSGAKMLRDVRLGGAVLPGPTLEKGYQLTGSFKYFLTGAPATI